jgi:hypothetical protein
LNRQSSISNNDGSNTIRQTNYNINDTRLVLNSKEVDLLSIASGIEHDVWCYIVDNPCLLSGVSTCNDCTTNCCGDNKLDFDNLMTQPLSNILTVEDFNHYLISELIDAKSRQTLSGYPTLRAIYDRYLNSELYCSTVSAKFNYLNMDWSYW